MGDEALGGTTRSHLEITERDEAGYVIATYIHSSAAGGLVKQTEDDQNLSGGLVSQGGRERVDIVLPASPKSFTRKLMDAFLPAGYPSSVSEDYLRYQIFDSFQAIFSSMASLLSSRAVLEGVGVGNASATPTNALYFSIIQMTVGRVATILFAYRFGTAIEPDCKMYRLLADVFNDASMILDCLSPVFPQGMRVAILAASSMLVSLCGVAGSCAKSCLSAHFAKTGNLGDLNAKESSQETVISLLGMLLGSLMISRVSSPAATWSALLILQALHLLTNYIAVRSVTMKSLNQQRTNIVVSALADRQRVLSPDEVSQQEHIFIRPGKLAWGGRSTVGFCTTGVSMTELLQRMSQTGKRNRHSVSNFNASVSALLRTFEHDNYILWFEESTRTATVVLKQDCQAMDQLKAWSQALLMARDVSERDFTNGNPTDILQVYKDRASHLLERYTEQLNLAGWDLDVSAIETRRGSRVVYNLSNK